MFPVQWLLFSHMSTTELCSNPAAFPGFVNGRCSRATNGDMRMPRNTRFGHARATWLPLRIQTTPAFVAYPSASALGLPFEMSSSNVSHHSVNLPSPLPLLLLCLFFLIPVSFLIPLQAIIICMVISMSSYILIKMYHLQCIFVIFVSILALFHPLNLIFLISPPPDIAVLFPAF